MLPLFQITDIRSRYMGRTDGTIRDYIGWRDGLSFAEREAERL